MPNEGGNAPTIVPSFAYDDVPRAGAWRIGAFGCRARAGSRLSWPWGSTVACRRRAASMPGRARRGSRHRAELKNADERRYER